MVKKVWKNFKKGLCCTLAVIVCAGTMSTLTVNAAPTNTFEDVSPTRNWEDALTSDFYETVPIPEGVKAISYIIESGNQGSVVLNEHGDPIMISEPYRDTQLITYEYDNLGRMVTMSEQYSKWSYSYNANNQVISVKKDWMNTTTGTTYTSIYLYEYDAHGNVVRETMKNSDGKIDSEAVWAYTYDEFGRMIEQYYGENSKGKAVVREKPKYQYIYNADGSYMSIQGPDTNYPTYDYYDAADKLLREGLLIGMEQELPNNIYTYNEQGLRVTRNKRNVKEKPEKKDIEVSDAYIITYNYTFDELGRITSMTKYDPGVRWGYDTETKSSGFLFNPSYAYYFYEY